jgi:hypothetical protein
MVEIMNNNTSHYMVAGKGNNFYTPHWCSNYHLAQYVKKQMEEEHEEEAAIYNNTWFSRDIVTLYGTPLDDEKLTIKIKLPDNFVASWPLKSDGSDINTFVSFYCRYKVGNYTFFKGGRGPQAFHLHCGRNTGMFISCLTQAQFLIIYDTLNDM